MFGSAAIAMALGMTLILQAMKHGQAGVVAILSSVTPIVVLPLLWLVGFWSVHVVFEVQGRYFLGLFVLAPLLCAAVARLAAPPDVAGGGGSRAA